MKNSVLFKSLIDIFFFLHVIGLIANLINIPLGFSEVGKMDEPQFLGWILFAINSICYFIFVRGLFFLRKLARGFLFQKYFTDSVGNNMKISGNNFLYAGLISILTLLVDKLFNLNLEPVYKSFTIPPIFLIIVGMFFIIQSKTSSFALRLKNENDLVV